MAKAVPEPVLMGWGRIPAPGRELVAEDLEAATRSAQLCRGLGRSYGDSSLPASAGDKVVATRLANRVLAFDPVSGVIRVESGLSLAELNRIFMPRGWFTPVSPGTKFVTVGGMVSSDVHGGNHHVAGCFGEHVRALKIRLASNDIVECSASENDDLFYGVIGGMGLLGHILEVEFRLDPIPSSWLVVETEPVPDIDEFLAGLDRVAHQYPQTKGWIDCLNQGRSMGRGALIAGRWASAEEAGPLEPVDPVGATLPFDLPNWAVNNLTGRLFNSFIYWNFPRGRSRAIEPPAKFFYPLDAVAQWNRVFGARGFTQHQCVLPRRAGAEAVRELMRLVTKIGTASPVCVIKDCGPEGRGLLSFPLAGTSIAVDMPASARIQRDVDSLNELVIAAGGRIYLSKDRFTRAEHFRAMEPRLPRFMALREKWDPQRRLRSAQSVRIFGDRP